MLKKLAPAATAPVSFVRMEVVRGTEAQVDFGWGAWVMENGKLR